MWSHYKQYIETLQELKVPTHVALSIPVAMSEIITPFKKMLVHLTI